MKQLPLITNRVTVALERLLADPQPKSGIVERAIETYQLPSVLDLKVASSLREQFVGRRGSALRVDASRVERLGGLCLQILIAARTAWADDRQDFMLEDSSSELTAVLGTFGLTPLALNYREE